MLINVENTGLIIGIPRMGKSYMSTIVAAAKRDPSSSILQAMVEHIEQRRHPVAQLASWVRQTLSLSDKLESPVGSIAHTRPHGTDKV